MKLHTQYDPRFEAGKLQRASDYEVSYNVYWNIIPTVNIKIAKRFRGYLFFSFE